MMERFQEELRKLPELMFRTDVNIGGLSSLHRCNVPRNVTLLFRISRHELWLCYEKQNIAFV